MAIAKPPRITEADFLRLRDNGRKYELVHGEIQEVPATVRHDEIGAIVIYRLTPFVIGRGILCSSQAGFRMRNGNVRSPDVSFVRRERLPNGEAPNSFGDGAPDLCIEIISPSEDRNDMVQKLNEYFGAGATEVWHIFPETISMEVFTAPDQSRRLLRDDEIVSESLLPGFALRVEQLFFLP